MKFIHVILIILILSSLSLFIGCAKDANTTTGPTGIDSLGSQAAVNTANDQLGTILNTLINEHPGPQEPIDINLSTPYGLYLHALALDSTNATASFGAGMLEIVMLSQDNQTNHEFDVWKAFGDSGSFFEVPMGGTFRHTPSGIQPVLRGSDITMPIFSSVSMMKSMTGFSRIQTTDPMFSEAQDYFTNVLIPKLDITIGRLQRVAANPSFTFHVTGRMQGDPAEDDVILDLTEVNATLTALYSMKAMLLQFSAYNVDFTAYTGAGMQTALTVGSPFMRLRSSGAANLLTARSSWLSATNALDSAIYHLEHETGNTSLHLIKYDDNNGLTHANVDSMKVYIPKFRNALTTSEHFMVDADGDSTTPDVNLEVSLNAVFTNPINDIKTLFPAYTVSIDTAMETSWNGTSNYFNANVYFPNPTSFNYDRSADYNNGVLTDSSYNVSMPVPQFDTDWYNMVAQYRNDVSAHLEMHASGYFNGNVQINANFYVNYEYVKRYRVEPVITWTATSFATWNLPNFTFNGLLPGITSSDNFKSVFGITGDGWQQVQTLHLWH